MSADWMQSVLCYGSDDDSNDATVQTPIRPAAPASRDTAPQVDSDEDFEDTEKHESSDSDGEFVRSGRRKRARLSNKQQGVQIKRVKQGSSHFRADADLLGTQKQQWQKLLNMSTGKGQISRMKDANGHCASCSLRMESLIKSLQLALLSASERKRHSKTSKQLYHYTRLRLALIQRAFDASGNWKFHAM